MDDIRRRLTHGVTWVTLGKVLLALSGLAANVLITRLLPPEDVGTWFLLFSLVSVFALIAQAGLNQASIRLIAAAKSGNTPWSVRGIVRTTLLLATAGTLVTVILFAAGGGSWIGRALFDIDLSGILLLLASGWLALLVYRNLLAETFRGLSEFRYATLFEGLLDGLVFALLLAAFLLIRGTGTLEQIFMLAVSACGLATVTAGLVAGRRLRAWAPGASAPFAVVLGTAWPLWVTGITIFALGKADLWILGLFRELDEVGVYGAVSRLATFTGFTLLIANAVVPPLIAELHSRDDHRAMEQTLRSVATLSLIPALAIVVVFAAWPGALLGLLYGDYYRSGSLALLILAGGHLVNVACGSCGYVLMMTRHQVLMMVITLLSGGVTILVCTLLAPGYGGAGVAAGMSAGLILQNLLMLAAVRHHLGIWTHARLRIPAIGRRLEEQGS